MCQHLDRRHPLLRITLNHPRYQLHPILRNPGHMKLQIRLLILGEYNPLLLEIVHALRPLLLGRGARHRKHLIELINSILPGKRLVAEIQLDHDAAQCENVDVDGVRQVEDELRGAVPAGGDVVGVDRRLPAFAQAEVHHFYVF